VLTHQPEPVEQAMTDYGKYLGTAFQIIDDVMDYCSQSEEMGKNVGDDLAEGKPPCRCCAPWKWVPRKSVNWCAMPSSTATVWITWSVFWASWIAPELWNTPAASSGRG
jgi:hypothetical protein